MLSTKLLSFVYTGNTTDKIYSWIEAVRGINVEQAMDQIAYGGQSYSEPLGAFTTGHPYIQDWNEDVEACSVKMLESLVSRAGSAQKAMKARMDDLAQSLGMPPGLPSLHGHSGFLVTLWFVVGVAAFDLRSASLHLSEHIETSCTSYQNTKTLLHFYDPNVLILPSSLPSDDALSHLVDSSVRKVTMLRAAFDDTRGALLVKSLAAKEPSALGLDSYYKHYYLYLAAASATITQIEADKGVVITSHPLSTRCILLFSAQATKIEVYSRFLTTRTTEGTRLLRANLLQPLKDVQTINAQLDCLVSTPSYRPYSYSPHNNTGRVLCHFCFKPKKVTNQVVLGIDNGRKSQLLISSIIVFKTALDALPFLSKAGIDGFLDIARRSFCDTSEAIHNLANKYREDCSLFSNTLLVESVKLSRPINQFLTFSMTIQRLLFVDWNAASQISDVTFVDQDYYKSELLSFKKELELLGVVVKFDPSSDWTSWSQLDEVMFKFEFQLRLQEFIELGRGADKLPAVKLDHHLVLVLQNKVKSMMNPLRQSLPVSSWVKEAENSSIESLMSSNMGGGSFLKFKGLKYFVRGGVEDLKGFEGQWELGSRFNTSKKWWKGIRVSARGEDSRLLIAAVFKNITGDSEKLHEAIIEKECLFPFKGIYSTTEDSGVSLDPTHDKARNNKSKKRIADVLAESFYRSINCFVPIPTASLGP
ncbi:DNA mismatch repair protein MSH4 [Tanacetum coccineum]